MNEECVFCQIVRGTIPASVVYEDAATLAFVDVRQFHAGHVLVIPRTHLLDVLELDPATGVALMAMVARMTRAVGRALPHESLSLWHSIGPAAFQEVSHLHFHIHPRFHNDDFLRVYPGELPTSDEATRERYAEREQIPQILQILRGVMCSR